MTDTFLWKISQDDFKLTGLTACCTFQAAAPASGTTPAKEAGYITNKKCVLPVPVEATFGGKNVLVTENIDICELVGTMYTEYAANQEPLDLLNGVCS